MMSHRVLYVLIVVLFGVALPRYAALSGLPATDEGFYTFYSQIVYNEYIYNSSIPDYDTLNLYSLVLSPIFSFNANHIVIFRIVDFAVSCAVGFLYYKIIYIILKNDVLATLLSVVILLAVNDSVFIQNGFKNSMQISALFFLASYLLYISNQGTTSRSNAIMLLSGVLICFGALFRETFIPVAIFSIVAYRFAISKKYFFYVSITFVLIFIFAFIVVGVLRNNLFWFIDAYYDRSQIYLAYGGDRLAVTLLSFKKFLSATYAPLFVLIYIFLCRIFCKIRGVKLFRLTSFLSCVIFILLLEPLYKIGFPYHFSILLYPLGIIAAWLLSDFEANGKLKFVVYPPIFAFVSFFVLINLFGLLNNLKNTNAFFKSSGLYDWPSDQIEKSNYLIAARRIISLANSNSCGLSVSGWMYALFPLTKMQPSNYSISDLTIFYIRHGQSKDEVTRQLINYHPCIVLLSDRDEWPGYSDLKLSIIDSGLYDYVGDLEHNTHLSYGHFGGEFYKFRSRQ